MAWKLSSWLIGEQENWPVSESTAKNSLALVVFVLGLEADTVKE